MKTNTKYILSVLVLLLLVSTSCTQETYSLGGLTAPSNVVINTVIVGKDATHPNGDGSGNVNISVEGANILAYKIDYGTSSEINLVPLVGGKASKKYSPPNGSSGVFNFLISVVVYGKGGVTTTANKEVTVRIDFMIPPEIIANLTNGTSKTWVVDKSVAGHLGVGPWVGSATPEWWSASIDEKVASANCVYTATYNFTKLANGTYTLQVVAPDGIYANASHTNLPFSGSGESCFPYAGSLKTVSFGTSTSDMPNAASTKINFTVLGNDGFVGYGSCSNTYEILSITNTSIYLRSQGVEPGNAWYLKLKPAQ
jgi:hypothetical protein